MAPKDNEAGERFLLARGLYALLSGATQDGPRLLTGAGTAMQAAGRAFAAELLAPAAALRARIGAGVDEEQVEELAREFKVSSQVIDHQLENHRLRYR
jgi:Zn-dependent peptidase ImmA (M78 family)